MSPLRPTSTSSKHAAISPLGLMLCALATLVAVPVLLAGGAGTEGVEVAAVAVPSTESAIEVDGEIEIEGLFAAGARLDDMPVVPTPEPDPRAAAVALVEAGDVSTTGLVDDVISAEPQSALVDDGTLEPADASPQTSPVDSQPATTAPPSTAPPETAPPETAPPETAPPETAAPETGSRRDVFGRNRTGTRRRADGRAVGCASAMRGERQLHRGERQRPLSRGVSVLSADVERIGEPCGAPRSGRRGPERGSSGRSGCAGAPAVAAPG